MTWVFQSYSTGFHLNLLQGHILDFTSFHRRKSVLSVTVYQGIGFQNVVHGPEAIALPENLLGMYILKSHSIPTDQKLWDGAQPCVC